MIYEALLLLSLFPRLFQKKPIALRSRLRFTPPDPQGKSTLWIHAISVGELRAAIPLYHSLRKRYPDHFFLLTTTTLTGLQEAHRLHPDAAHLLPLDLRWIMRRWVRRLKPTHFFLIESDFWWNLLRHLKQAGCRIYLINGKLSLRSSKRFYTLCFLSRRLFAHFDTLFLQSDIHRQRFLPLTPDPTRIHVTGNIKIDQQPTPLDLRSWPKIPTLTIASTHDPEEELLLTTIRPLLPQIRLFLAPRHPHRLPEIITLLNRLSLPFSLFSKPPFTSLILVDTLGQLATCYSLSQVALVGGSFLPTIGGHNVLEPCLYGAYSLFGPYTQQQSDLVQEVLTHHAGSQVLLKDLLPTLQSLFNTPFPRVTFSTIQSPTQKILELI